ncbi:MAG: hypothetical protein K2H69_01945 [Alistipes sp.]|nr:hypothetical protein [Alistipes sp.]
MIRHLFLALLLAGTALPGNAQQPVSGEVAAARETTQLPDNRRPERRPPLYGRHEFRFSAGIAPARIGNYWWENESFDLSVGQQFDRTKYYRGDTRSTGAYALSYAYRFRRWFALSVGCSYSGEQFDRYSNLTGRSVRRYRLHRFSLIPAVRFTWLDRPWVRLYSSAGIGLQLIGGDRSLWGQSTDQAALHFIPLGLAVGRSLFGFAEFGYSSQGCIAFGIGYSFNAKKRGS